VEGSDNTPSAGNQSTEFLAPVTYLFGATAPRDATETAQTDELSEPFTTAQWATPTVRETAHDTMHDTVNRTVAKPESTATRSEETPTPGSRLSGGSDGSFERVNNVSMHALARRGMSSAEMTRLLESREIDPDSVAEEIDRLEGVGLLDDRALAENLVRTLQERKGLGRSAITAELRRRKINNDAITEALDELDGDDELARAIEIAQKRASQLRSYDHETAKRRLSGFLMRRGYNGSIVSAAIAASLGSPGRGNGGSGPRFS
jgi:SOS response regulatory protein OraA/RecX